MFFVAFIAWPLIENDEVSHANFFQRKQNLVNQVGAKVVAATHGLKTLKEAVDSAFGKYLEDPESSLFCIGSVVGPHPFPMMVSDFQRVVGIEAREQFLDMTGKLPDNVVACVGGGSNAIGLFSAFLDDMLMFLPVLN